MKDSLAEQIMERPDARLILDEVNQMLEAERRLRQNFYETVREDQKAEFINGEIMEKTTGFSTPCKSTTKSTPELSPVSKFPCGRFLRKRLT